jgi:hypothetical protein
MPAANGTVQHGVPGSSGNVARDCEGQDQLGSFPGAKELDAGDMKNSIPGHQGAAEIAKKKDCHSAMSPGVPLPAKEGPEDTTGLSSGWQDQRGGEPSNQITTPNQMTKPTPANAYAEAEGVVNDCKAELFEETFVNSADVAGGYVPEEVKSTGLLPQGLTMKSNDFSKYAVRAEKQGDRQPLRDAVRIMDHHRLTPHEFAGLSEAAMVVRVEQYVCSTVYGSIAATMANPKRLVRQIRYGLARLSRQFPDAGLPVTAEPEDRCLHPLPPSLQVGLLGRQVKSWNPRLLGVEDPTATGGAMKPQTKLDYIGKLWTLANVCRNAGVDINEMVGIEALIRPDVVDIWLPAAAKHYSEKGIAPFISGIRRIAADLLGEEHSDVATLRKHVGTYFAEHGITKEQAKEAHELANSDGTNARTIWTMSQAMQARARGAGRLSAADRDGRASRAAAAEILVSNPAMQPGALSQLRLDYHIKGGGYTRTILVNIAGQDQWQPMTRDACDRLDQLLAFRAGLGRTSPFLFPAKCGTRPQERRVAMTSLIKDMSAVLRRPVRSTQIKDAVRIANFERTPQFVTEISEATGLMSARSAERRYGIIFDRPDPPGSSEGHS